MTLFFVSLPKALVFRCLPNILFFVPFVVKAAR
jgi:hypothetical protein